MPGSSRGSTSGASPRADAGRRAGPGLASRAPAPCSSARGPRRVGEPGGRRWRSTARPRTRGSGCSWCCSPACPSRSTPPCLSPFLRIRTWVDYRGDRRRARLPGAGRRDQGRPVGPASRSRAERRAAVPRARGFDEGDAELFFGREADIQRLLEKLKAAAVPGGARRVRAAGSRRSCGPDWCRRCGAACCPGATTGRSSSCGRARGRSRRWPPGCPRPGRRADGPSPRRARGRPAGAAPGGVAGARGRPPEAAPAARGRSVRGGVHAVPRRRRPGMRSSRPALRGLGARTAGRRWCSRCAPTSTTAAAPTPSWPAGSARAVPGQPAAERGPARRRSSSRPGASGCVRAGPGGHDRRTTSARQPGALPLLEHALLELWQRRRGACSRSPATRRAAACRARWRSAPTQVFDALDAASSGTRRAARCCGSPQPGEGTEDTRRRARLAELAGGGGRAGPGAAVSSSDARLLTTSRDETPAARWSRSRTRR